jgi:hypothetical protein
MLQGERPSRRAAGVGLGACLVLALALRLRGSSYFLPHSTHLDALVIHNQVESLRAGHSSSGVGPVDEWYPYLLARLTTLLPDALATSEPLDLAGHLARAATPLLQIRLVSIAGSIAIVLGTYHLARKFTTRAWSLFAAALLATSTLNISFAQQERPHALAASFVVLTVLAALRLERRPTLGSCALVGAAASLAIGALQNGAAVGFPIVAAVALAVARRDAQQPKFAQVLVGGALCTALIAVGIRVCYPFHFTGDRGYLSFAEQADGTTFNLSGQTVYLEHFDGSGFATVLGALYSYSPHILALCAVALAAAIARSRRPVRLPRRRAALWIALAYAAPYTLVIGLHSLTWERYVMPLEPFLAAFAAWGAGQLFAARPRAAIAAAALAVAFSTACAWRLGSVRAAPDTFTLAARWVGEHARAEVDPILSLPYIDLPLLYRAETLDARPALTYWTRYQAACAPQERVGPRFDVVLPKDAATARAEWGRDPLRYLRDSGARFVVLQHVSDNFRYKLALRTREALAEHAQLRARFSPRVSDGGAHAGLGIRRHREALSRPFVVSLFQHARMGPTLEIYELPGP